MNKYITPGRVMLGVLVLTGALYLSLFNAPALNWDDDSNVFANPYFRAGWWSTFWTSNYFGLYVPVTSTTWHALYVWGDGAAWPFRILNVSLHLINVCLVYFGLIALGRRRGWRSSWAPVVGAALFALHPLQVQAVAWISGGRDLLATTLAFTALLLYFVRSGAIGRTLATAAFALAILSKPNVVILPVIVACLAPLVAPGEPRRRHVPWLVGWTALGAVVIWWTIGAQAEHLPEVAWWQRPWLMGDAYWFYQTHLLNVFTLSANYARTPAAVLARPITLIGAVAGVVIPGVLILNRRAGAWRPLILAWAAWLLPVSGIVSFGYQQTSGVADHYAYPAMAMVAALVADLCARARGRAWAAVMVAIATGWLIVDARRLEAWRSNAAFFTDMSRAAPDAYATAIGMSGVACGEQQRFDEGVRWTEVALTARPLDIRALANQAYCLLHARQFKRVAELDFYFDRLDQDRLARVEPTGYTSFLASVGSAKIELGQLKDGYQFLCEAQRLLPSEPVHQRNLDLAAALMRRQKLVPSCVPDEEPNDEDQ